MAQVVNQVGEGARQVVQVCGPVLPSASAAARFMEGEPGSLGEVIASWVMRGAVIAGGMWLFGYRDQPLRRGLAGAAAIEAVVLGWAYMEKRQRDAIAAAKQQLAAESSKSAAAQRSSSEQPGVGKDYLKGGKADRYGRGGPPFRVSRAQLRLGTEVEREHTVSRALAREIALDHLAEDPRYYTKLLRAGL